MDLVKRKHRYVAIDVDRRQVRLVIFECAGRKFSIQGLHTAAIGPGVDAGDAASLGAFLGTVVEQLGLAGSRAIMCVERSQAVLKSLALPPAADASELASMVRFQVGKELPFSADEAVVDYTHGAHWGAGELAEGGPQSVSILAAAVRLPVIDAAREVCERAHLHLKRLGLRPYANLQAVYRCVRATPGERILLVDLNGEEAEIDLMCNRTLEFSRSAAVAPTAGPEPPDGLVRRIVGEVTRSLQSFQAVQRGGPIHACLVAGDTGLEKHVTRALSEQLKVRCEMFAPGGGFSIPSGQSVSGFAAALGLAAGQADESLPFDFLNPKRPAPPRDRRKIYAGLIAAVAVLLVAAGTVTAGRYFSRRAGDILQLRNDQKALQTQKKSLDDLAKRVNGVEKELAAQQDWLAHLRFLSEALPDAREVYIR
ncbi:MAG TPA: pilus assembly protein PilM, partial [Phycisphaerae bacterium]|nr:pilus assembly protein PilM [Phycisphaerae bacterium]